MGIARVATGNARDGKRKGQGNPCWIAVCAEAHFATGETLETTQGGIVTGLPRIPNLQRGLPLIHVTRAVNPVPPVYFVATMSAVSTDNAVKAGFDGFHGIFRFAENPHLEHVARFPVVRGMGKAGGDDHTGMILMKEKSVQREPPTINSAKQ